MTSHPPAYDNHVHIRPDGLGTDALREFERTGGTGITLVNLPYPQIRVRNAGDFVEQYRLTMDMAERAGRETGLLVNVALGPYPVLLIPLREEHGPEAAEEIMMEAMEEAARLVSEGRAQALGEIGRPHFPVDEAVRESSDRILTRGMELAREVGCPVVIHCESATPETMEGLARMADRCSLPRDRVVKHSAPALTTEELGHGILCSVPASRKTVRQALAQGGPFLMETDYIDDPGKPGAVMSITSVPKRVRGMTSSGEMDEETAWRIGHDIPARLYGPR